MMILLFVPVHAKPVCGKDGVWLQDLGSGGPELEDGRASTDYLIRDNGKARLLVDMGSGSMLQFEKSAASANDLHVVLFSNFQVDHSNAFAKRASEDITNIF